MCPGLPISQLKHFPDYNLIYANSRKKYKVLHLYKFTNLLNTRHMPIRPHCHRSECRITITAGRPKPKFLTHTHTHTQPFNGLLSGTTRVGRYQKKHSPTHTHPDHRTSFIIFLNLQRSKASSLLSLRA